MPIFKKKNANKIFVEKSVNGHSRGNLSLLSKDMLAKQGAHFIYESIKMFVFQTPCADFPSLPQMHVV